MKAMEGSETCECLKKHTKTLHDGTKKDSKMLFLEFQGNMLQYLSMLDKIEGLEGCESLSEEKQIKVILKGVVNKDYQLMVLQLQRELKAGSLTLAEKTFTELRAVKTHVNTQYLDDTVKTSNASVAQCTKEQLKAWLRL